MIKAEIVADSISPQGDRLISVLCTFPRIILAEVNTHRMLSKNTSSSRAIPFEKMVEAVKDNPFIPTAWQKEHKGMQGNEYIEDVDHIEISRQDWLKARDNAIESAKLLNSGFEDELSEIEERIDKVTKQLCNRLLEPFMWTTMLITGTYEGGWDNFFELRCPQYEFEPEQKSYKSKKEWVEAWNDTFEVDLEIPKRLKISNFSDLRWLEINKGQAEIHMMDLAEKIYDAVNESSPRQLGAGEWHIPFENQIKEITRLRQSETLVKISTAMAARTSYTLVGEEKELDYKKMIDLHDRLISQDPPHSSPMEHCARAMNESEYSSNVRGEGELHDPDYPSYLFRGNTEGWCRNFKGFIPYRHIVESEK